LRQRRLDLAGTVEADEALGGRLEEKADGGSSGWRLGFLNCGGAPIAVTLIGPVSRSPQPVRDQGRAGKRQSDEKVLSSIVRLSGSAS
jgi:hypothetical protein